MDAETIYLLGLFLIFAGVIIILVTAVLLFILGIKKDEEKAEVKGGGAIILGPFPIVFGTDQRSLKTVLVLSVILTLVTVVFYFLSS
ncbi:MAG: TIGR00304 family membrane protein [Thermoproteota archaeon]